MPADFPHLRNPPLVECVMGVHFRPLIKMSTALQGKLWVELFSRQYPKTADKPRIDEKIESFGGAEEMTWVFQPGVDVPRLMASDADGIEFVQIQQNAFYTNWNRRSDPALPYKHYEERRQEFASLLAQIGGFVEREDIGEISPTSCSMTYLNRIKVDEQETAYDKMVELTPLLDANILGNGRPSNAALTFGYDLEEKRGRLRVSIKSSRHRITNDEVVVFELVARSTPLATLDDVFLWFDRAHCAIRDGFVATTRSGIRKKWEGYE